jgi:5-methylcytosine-specific restriction protein B
LHNRWLSGVLGSGDSLFTPGSAIWTADHLDELERDFSGKPDLTKGKRFLEKLHDQLANASPEAIQLMAELHAVHFLIIWIGAISAAKKRSDLEAILAWMPVPCAVPDSVLEAMTPGLVHPGQWAMTRRDTQLTWLIRFSRAWKDLPDDRQRLLVTDPWALKDFAEETHAPTSDSARLALLHLAHPDTFEPSVSPNHKQLIAERFAEVAGGDPDIDRRLLTARAAMTPVYGERFGWYDDPLVRLWWKDRKTWSAFLRWLERFHTIQEGPGPEQASTAADQSAVDFSRAGWLEDDPTRVEMVRDAWQLTHWGDGPEGATASDLNDRAMAFLDELVRDSNEWPLPLRDREDAYLMVQRLITCTVKPATWSDVLWVEFREYRGLAVPSIPEQTEDGPETQDGDSHLNEQIIDHIAVAAKDLHVDRAVLDEIVELLDDKGQVVLYGPPGTGKTYLAVRLAKAIGHGHTSRVSVVQFHPATSYEDFFEGLRPEETEAGQVMYRRRRGPLVVIAERAAADPTRTYVLVIDEINRANLPKVFGELLFLLENRAESVQTLYRPEEPFLLPENLWFIGTMNTADRSIALIDAAMRRRFHFVPFFPHDGPMKNLLRSWLSQGGGRLGVADLLDEVNKELLALVGEHLLIGPSHFMKTDLSDRALARIWTYNIFPLIEEQLWGDQQAIARWRWQQVKARFAGTLAVTSAAETEGDEPGSV